MVDPLNISHYSQCSMTGMCYPVCGVVHIKEPLLLIRKSSPYSVGSEFLFSLYGHLPYVQCHITILKCVEYVVKHISFLL